MSIRAAQVEVEAIREALRLIRRPRGWCQGTYYRGRDTGRKVKRVRKEEDCSFCLAGALHHAAEKCGASPWYTQAMVAHTHGDHAPHPVSITTWNDEPVRTKREVESLLRRSLKQWREQVRKWEGEMSSRAAFHDLLSRRIAK